jgi:hypothetical protein
LKTLRPRSHRGPLAALRPPPALGPDGPTGLGAKGGVVPFGYGPGPYETSWSANRASLLAIPKLALATPYDNSAAAYAAAALVKRFPWGVSMGMAPDSQGDNYYRPVTFSAPSLGDVPSQTTGA